MPDNRVTFLLRSTVAASELRMSRGRTAQFLRVVDELYESALEPSRWSRALDELCSFVNAIAADLYISSSSNQVPFVSFTGISDDLMNDYLAYFHDQNARVKAVERRVEGGLVLDYDVASQTEMARSAYYQDLVFKNGYGLFIGGAALNRSDESALFGIHYARDAEPYQQEHFRRLKQVMPHIHRAARLHNQLAASAAGEQRLAAVVESLTQAIAVVNHRSKVAYINRAAEDLLTRANSISIKGQRVTLVQPELDRKLESMIANTVHHSCPEGSVAGALRVDNPASGPISIMVFPLPRRVRLEESVDAILVFSEAFSRLPPRATSILSMIFDLTPAEAEVATALANGESVKGFAERTRRSVETVRGYLKSAMNKTGVKSQPALVRLILNVTRPMDG